MGFVKVLIVYATNSSGTQVASETIGQSFSRHHHQVVIKRADQIEPDDLKNRDLLIFGSCTWERVMSDKHLDGQLQQHFQILADKLQGVKLSGQKIAIFGLGDSGYRQFAAAADILQRLVSDLGAEHVGPTLKVDRFYFEFAKNRPLLESWAEDVMRQAG